MPPLSLLERCAMRNPDGCGFATPETIYKSLRFTAFVKHLCSLSTDTPAIIHFRLATHGSICRDNCHPFKDARSSISFAHNGVLSIEPVNDLTDSETAFRFYFMPIIAQYGLYSIEFESVVKSIIGGSKFAFINQEGNLRMFGKFIKQDGCYYSNYSFAEMNSLEIKYYARYRNHKMMQK